jgi:hypothetical protein
MAKTGYASMASNLSEDLGDIDALLGKISEDLKTKTLKKAGKRAGKVVADRYMATAPTGKTGNLKSSIPTKLSEIKTFTTANEQVISAVVAMKRPQGSHAHLVEFGHKIRARGKKGQGKGKWIGRSTSPGNQLANAVKDTSAQQTAAIVKVLADEITKQGG